MLLLLLLQFLLPSPLLIRPFLLLVYNTTSLQADWFADWLIDSNMKNQEKVVQEKRKGLWTEEKMKVGSWFLIRKLSSVDLSPSCLMWTVDLMGLCRQTDLPSPGSFSPSWPKRAFSLPGSQNDQITFKINKSEIILSFPLVTSPGR